MNKADQATEMLLAMNEIDEKNYSQILHERVGVELLSLFERYCRELVPEDEDNNILNTLVHLMITGYLIHSNEEQSLFGPTIETA